MHLVITDYFGYPYGDLLPQTGHQKARKRHCCDFCGRWDGRFGTVPGQMRLARDNPAPAFPEIPTVLFPAPLRP